MTHPTEMPEPNSLYPLNQLALQSLAHPEKRTQDVGLSHHQNVPQRYLRTVFRMYIVFQGSMRQPRDTVLELLEQQVQAAIERGTS